MQTNNKISTFFWSLSSLVPPEYLWSPCHGGRSSRFYDQDAKAGQANCLYHSQCTHYSKNFSSLSKITYDLTKSTVVEECFYQEGKDWGFCCAMCRVALTSYSFRWNVNHVEAKGWVTNDQGKLCRKYALVSVCRKAWWGLLGQGVFGAENVT